MQLKPIKYSDIETFPNFNRLANNLKKEFFGSAPGIFVGTYGYPNVNLGILAPQEIDKDSWIHDAPKFWAQNKFAIDKITDLRMSLINSKEKANIKLNNKMVEISQEVALSSKPIDLEISLKKKPALDYIKDNIVTPIGPSAEIQNARITENPKIPTQIQKVFYDNSLKAIDAIKYLYKHEFDENTITKTLSVGAIGIKNNRKLVPTRWSITAVDDTLGKQIINEIKEYNFSDYLSFFGGYIGNYFLILFLPEIWSYELFELYVNTKNNVSDMNGFSSKKELKYSTDYELYNGRINYAENCAGGYYANRLSVLEKLKELKRQATVIVLRFITDEYTAPLGVWVVREATKIALTSNPIKFSSKELLIKYSKLFIQKKFGLDGEKIFYKSIILNNLKKQTKLGNFIK